jgi:hypothetical protein
MPKKLMKNLVSTIIIFFIIIFFLCTYSHISQAAAEDINQSVESFDTTDELINTQNNDLIDNIKSLNSTITNQNEHSGDLSQNFQLKPCSSGKIIALNKITAKSKELSLKLNEPQYFGNIQITLHKCIKNLDPYNEDNYLLLTITEHKIDDDSTLIFQGWLISSSVSISTFEHPIYEIFAKNCL